MTENKPLERRHIRSPGFHGPPGAHRLDVTDPQPRALQDSEERLDTRVLHNYGLGVPPPPNPKPEPSALYQCICIRFCTHVLSVFCGLAGKYASCPHSTFATPQGHGAPWESPRPPAVHMGHQHRSRFSAPNGCKSFTCEVGALRRRSNLPQKEKNDSNGASRLLEAMLLPALAHISKRTAFRTPLSAPIFFCFVLH